MKKYTICLIHNTHTDVGFTGVQEEIELQHYDYLLQVVDILESGKNPDFKWQCENTWQIDNFYEYADETEKLLLEKWIKRGNIGLSGNYLNMTEIADAKTTEYWIKHARKYAETLGVNSMSAMSCDVNGYGWALPDLLSRNGYKYFLGSIHTHHGMYPINRCPSCFRWVGPDGGSVLTFISEHYNLGNELGLCPHSMLSYNVHDRYSHALEFSMLRTDDETTEREEMEVSQYRIIKYLEGLEAAGYEFDNIPILVSGAYTDNSVPNAAICERIQKLNELLGDSVHIELMLLDEFFDRIEKSGVRIQSFSGDFPDWWASGIGTLPNSVKLYRQAQRMMRLTEKLEGEGQKADEMLRKEAMKKAVLFAEHTWSYCATVFYPWSIQNKAVELKNAAYAADFHTLATKNFLRIQRAMGGKQPYAGREYAWTIINPHSLEICCPVTLPIDAWEYVDGCKFDAAKYCLKNDETGEVIPSQVRATPRGPAFETYIPLKANERVTVRMEKKEAHDALINHLAAISTDGVRDVYSGEGIVSPSVIDTPYFSVRIQKGKGITSIFDKVRGTEFVTSGDYSAFTGIMDATPVSEDSGVARKLTRRSMGRNQVAFATERHKAELKNSVVAENGTVYALIELTYQLEGADRYKVRLKVYKQAPVISAEVIMGVSGGIDPESIYIALPFAASGDTYIGKAGCVMRPGMDQLPGTCKALYAVQDGIIRENNESDLLISFEDVPLVMFGLPEHQPVMLCGENEHAHNAKPMFAWAVNNYWETNFPCNTAGDYQFNFTLTASEHDSAANQMEKIRAVSEGFVVLRK